MAPWWAGVFLGLRPEVALRPGGSALRPEVALLAGGPTHRSPSALRPEVAFRPGVALYVFSAYSSTVPLPIASRMAAPHLAPWL